MSIAIKVLAVIELIVLGLMIWNGFVFKTGSFLSFELYPMSRFFKKKE